MRRPEDQVLALYQSRAGLWPGLRGQTLFERPWLERFLAAMPEGRRVLDLGCGTGQPLAAWLAGQGCAITGVDGAPAMVAQAKARMPGHHWHLADLRALPNLGRFDGLLCWHSSFHLSQEAQRAFFAGLQRFAAPGAALMFTSGPGAGEVVGDWQGGRLYHASLDPAEYRAILQAAGFAVLAHVPEDPECGGATVWLAKQGG